MNDEHLLLHYDCLSKLDELYFSNLLTKGDIIEPATHFRKMFEEGKVDPILIDQVCAILLKNGRKYLLPVAMVDKLPIKITGSPPRYSSNKEVFYLLSGKTVVSARFKGEKTMSFRQFIDKLSSLRHSNPRHFKLYTMLIMTQMLDRANFRIATPPAFGKDSTVEIAGHMFGNAHTIENPTIAKLEMMTFAKLLAINEVMDISSGDWRAIEQFILSAAAFKNKIAKRTRAFGGVGEILDTSQFSMLVLYNDIDCYNSKVEYFDEFAKKAVKDRLPALRLYGNLMENFNDIARLDVTRFVHEHYNDYMALKRTFHYFKDNLFNELHHYEFTDLSSYPERWKTNFARLFRLIDAYSETEEEFREWCSLVRSTVMDYEYMANFKNKLHTLATKIQMPLDENERTLSLNYIIGWALERANKKKDDLSNRVFTYVQKISLANTYTEKTLLIDGLDVEKLKQGADLDKWI